jgi:hypothetical protein
VILSHWDTDHWAGEMTDPLAAQQTWVAPGSTTSDRVTMPSPGGSWRRAARCSSGVQPREPCGRTCSRPARATARALDESMTLAVDGTSELWPWRAAAPATVDGRPAVSK